MFPPSQQDVTRHQFQFPHDDQGTDSIADSAGMSVIIHDAGAALFHLVRGVVIVKQLLFETRRSGLLLHRQVPDDCL